MATNQEFAKHLFEIADLLELTGANGFRVNAYRKAARACESESQDLGKVAREVPSQLRQIDGIGESTSARIVELETTGRIGELDDLRKQVPAELPALLTLQGLGPKTVKLLWDSANVTSLAELSAAIDAGVLNTIPRMGVKTIANIKQAVVARLAAGDAPTRYRLGEAVPVARKLLGLLRDARGSIQTAIAGSARRGRETVGDIDLLVSTSDPEAAKQAFLTAPGVARILAHGDTRCSLLLNSGMQVDLRVVEDSAFGAALLYFTGNKDHNVYLRERAIERAMKLNEYGLFKVTGEKDGEPTLELMVTRTEGDIYKALGLFEWPPELRESMHDFTKPPPRLVCIADIKSELHAHTTASDGDLSLDELIALAEFRGFHTIAVTDHSKASAQANGLSVERLLAHIDAIRAAQERHPNIKVLAGSEVDILADGRLDYDDETLAKLDIVVASPHTALRQDPPEATKRLLAAIRHPLVHILGHPTGRIINGRDGISPDMDAIFQAAHDSSTALEINSHWMRLDLRDVHVRGALDRGCFIAIDCDVHSATDYDNLEYGVATARRGGLTPEHCINAWGPDRLHSWLRSKR